MTLAVATPTVRRLPLYGWLTADAISLLGTRISMIAIPWLVLITTGSPTQTGLVAAAEITPMVLLKAFGGPLVDRVGPRRMAITADSLSFLVVGLIPLLHHAGALSFPLLLVLVAAAGALRGPGDAASTALVPALVERAGVPYERATGLSSAIERGATMVGAALAGGLVATVGAANAVAVDAVSFALCALVLLVTTRSLETGGLARPDQRGETGEPETPSSYAAELRAGWNFLRGDAVLMSLCVMVAVTNLLDLAWSAVLLPVWAHDSGAGVGAVGLVFSVWGGASMLGSIVAAALRDVPRRLPGDRAPAVRAVRAGRAAVGDPRDVPRRRLVVRLPQPRARRRPVRTDPARHGRPGHCPVQRPVLVTDAARRCPRRRARQRHRPLPGHAGGRVRLLRRHHGPGPDPELPRDEPAGAHPRA
jgi:hypothetical protein